MKSEMIIFLICLISIEIYNQCSTYTCDTSITESICGKRLLNPDKTYNYSLRLCEKHNEICDVGSLISPLNIGTCKEFSSVTRLYPGETCQKNSECYTNRCENEICKGLTENSNCQKNYECDLGLYCYRNKCIQYLHEGSSEQCQSFGPYDARLCDPNLACGDGKCVQLGSLPIGDYAEEIWACQSGYVLFDFTEFRFRCQEGNVLKDSPNLTECPSDGKCIYQMNVSGKLLENKNDCQCGMRTIPSKVCPLGYKQLNSDFQKVVKYIKTHHPNCPFDRRFFCLKEPYHFEYFEALIAYQKYYDGEDEIFQNDNCTKVIFNNDYWTSIDIIEKK